MCLMTVLSETTQKSPVDSEPHYSSALCHKEKQTISLEIVNSAVYFDRWYFMTRLHDVFN